MWSGKEEERKGVKGRDGDKGTIDSGLALYQLIHTRFYIV